MISELEPSQPLAVLKYQRWRDGEKVSLVLLGMPLNVASVVRTPLARRTRSKRLPLDRRQATR